MANVSASQTRDNTLLQDDDPTQRVDPRCSKHEHICECIENDYICDGADSGNDRKLIPSHSDEEPEEPIQIHASCDDNTIAWEDGNNKPQTVDGICLKVDIDTLTSKALFKLSCWIWVKGKGKNKGQIKRGKIKAGNKQSIYLFIHPEDIRAITLEVKNDVPSLHFFMIRSPYLVIPSDRILECKNSTQPLLHSMKSLAKTDDFTIHLNVSNISDLTWKHLQHIALIFSATSINRPSIDDRRANLQTLYGGTGGNIFDVCIVCNEEEDGQLPPYEISTPCQIPYEREREHEPKRTYKRKREHENSDTESERSPATHNDNHRTKGSHIPSDDLKDVKEAPISRVEDHLKNDMIKLFLDGMENRLKNDLQSFLGGMENRLRSDFKNIVECTENRLRNDFKDVVDCTENRLKNEFKNILDERVEELENTLIDELRAARSRSHSRTTDIEREVDRAVDNIRTECIGTIDAEFKYIKYGMEEVTKGLEQAEEKTKDIIGLLDEAGGSVEKRIGRYLNGIRLQVMVDE
ncbi:hypothetical protein TARUN_395 [Trichoderma arundinaceum]|uniref:Uncharacterized protein n=1 Tax=Trichoderma arundinaceum TaxID=490622 RepID=A0A395P0G4_TRIAR|nr:hypothetical protein TARUN_395 [Trichoderma arundinaceum]